MTTKRNKNDFIFGFFRLPAKTAATFKKMNNRKSNQYRCSSANLLVIQYKITSGSSKMSMQTVSVTTQDNFYTNRITYGLVTDTLYSNNKSRKM